jgi:hypothetical protein
MEVGMRFESVWSADAKRLHGVLPVVRGGRATTARWGRRLCLACGERRPLFYHGGVVKADRDHTLCSECYRAEVNRLRACRLRAFAAGACIANSRPQPSKSIGDRAALLADIAARRRRAQMAARHAVEAPPPVRAAEALAS